MNGEAAAGKISMASWDREVIVVVHIQENGWCVGASQSQYGVRV